MDANFTLYLVTNGTAVADPYVRLTAFAHADEIADWTESVAALASSEAEAVALADAYDRREIEAGMHVYMGRTVVALRM